MGKRFKILQRNYTRDLTANSKQSSSHGQPVIGRDDIDQAVLGSSQDVYISESGSTTPVGSHVMTRSVGHVVLEWGGAQSAQSLEKNEKQNPARPC